MKNIILLLFVGFCFFSCGNGEVKQSPPQAEKKTDVNDDLVSRLSADLIIDPKTIAEKEQNALVNNAIEYGHDVQSTPSGIYFQILIPGKGVSPVAGDIISAHYTGSLLDGKIFDSSYKRGKAFDFTLQQVIPAWQEILPKLRPGAKAVLLVPSAQAYGEKGAGKQIPPNTPLKFEITILKIDAIDD